MNAVAPIDPNAYDRFILRQRIRLVINQYEFSLPEQGGEGADRGEPFCFVEQKRFKFKEDIRFFTDDTKTTEILRIKARQRFDPRARYDAGGNEVAVAQERNLFIALFRRFVGLVPYVGDFADWLPIPYHFDFRRGEEVLGTNNRQRWKWRDVYTIDMSGDPQHTVDRRMILAIAVGMDALQAR